MFVFILYTILITGGGGWGAELTDTGKCASEELNQCLELIPRTQVGLPRNGDQMDSHCLAYKTGMLCMNTWMTRCLPTDEQKLIHKQIQGAQAIMRVLCTNDSALRKEFLKDPTCLARVSPEWTRCVNEIQTAVREINEQTQLLTYVNKNADLCCARSSFLTCVAHAGQMCSSDTGNFLRKIAFVLAYDVGSCPSYPMVYCAAPSPLTGSVSILLTILILYLCFSLFK